jgi:hypothetical protein
MRVISRFPGDDKHWKLRRGRKPMKQVILVAHGEGNPSFSIPDVKTITKANSPLTFDEAKKYMEDRKSWSEYASTSFNNFDPLSDDDCR